MDLGFGVGAKLLLVSFLGFSAAEEIGCQGIQGPGWLSVWMARRLASGKRKRRACD